ncbi:MAG: hypothetical protein ABI556_16185, partial [Gemmatimonadales bacterium]
LADVAWRKTPPHEDSPFVTRTMAELYAKQGYNAAALDVYRQLAIANPDDQDILARIRELSGALQAPHADEPMEIPTSDESDQTSSVADEDNAAAVAEPPSAPPLEWVEDEIYTPALEEIEPEPEPAPAENRHFTEVELPPGDSWDTDTWGAGFSADESTDLELDVPDTPTLELSAPATDASASPAPSSPAPTESVQPAGSEQPAPSTDEAAVAEEQGVAVPETAASIEEEPLPAEEEPRAVEEPHAVEAEPEAEPSTTAPEAAPASAIPEVIAEPAAVRESETVDEDNEPHLVAYSPQPPDDEDLAHYEPKGPTVREFFATLGARRPPSQETAQSFTARAAVPSHENPSDYPLAASAFADLFPDSTIAEEDTRAAFALSGAMSATPAGPENPSAAETKRNTPPSPAVPVENAQESEEDIRRFREWLDGLAES